MGLQKISRGILAKKWLVIVLALAVLIPVWIGFYPREKKIEVAENKPVASVGDTLVYLKDIQQAAREQDESSSMTSEVLGAAFEVLVEQIILDNEAKNLQITITDQDIEDSLRAESQAADPTPTMRQLSPYEKKIARYNLIKKKVLKASLESREAYSIGFDLIVYSEHKERYTPSELDFFESQQNSLKKALPLIQQRLVGGEIFLSLAKSIYANNPYLQKIMKVNEYFMRSVNSENLIRDPRLYLYDKNKVGNLFIDTIFTLQPNETKLIMDQNDPGGYVIQLKAIHNEGIRTYEDWIKMKKSEMVKKYVSI